jgi:hypothetical protein
VWLFFWSYSIAGHISSACVWEWIQCRAFITLQQGCWLGDWESQVPYQTVFQILSWCCIKNEWFIQFWQGSVNHIFAAWHYCNTYDTITAWAIIITRKTPLSFTIFVPLLDREYCTISTDREPSTWGVSSRVTGRREHLIKCNLAAYLPI